MIKPPNRVKVVAIRVKLVRAQPLTIVKLVQILAPEHLTPLLLPASVCPDNMMIKPPNSVKVVTIHVKLVRGQPLMIVQLAQILTPDNMIMLLIPVLALPTTLRTQTNNANLVTTHVYLVRGSQRINVQVVKILTIDNMMQLLILVLVLPNTMMIQPHNVRVVSTPARHALDRAQTVLLVMKSKFFNGL